MSSRALYVAEPAAVWRSRPPLVVDCSVLASCLFDEDEAQDAALALRGHALHAPALLPFEFANVARSKSRAGAPHERIVLALKAFEDMLVELHPVPLANMHALALAQGLSAYDAAYLTLAASLEAPLLTYDHKLADAAARVLGAPKR
jgi:predicted nucleic acid-binding protein